MMAPVPPALLDAGRFFFRYRNALFPAVVLILCLGLPPGEWIGAPMAWVGAGAMFAGQALRMAVIGYAYIRRGGVMKQVYADDLVTSGFFAMSRNPLYVGNLLLYAGLFLVHGNPLAIGLGIGFFLLAYRSIVAAEENYLAGKFGEQYRQYLQSVPRWWLDFSRRREALEGMAFNWKRVVAKDYSTVCSTLLALLVVLASRAWHSFPAWPAAKPELLGLAYCAGLVLLLTLAARSAKKAGWLSN